MAAEHGALATFRILDLSGPEGQPCGRYLADLGADVVLVEPPGGSSSRRLGPFAGNQRDLERSLYFLHFNTNKRGIVLDLASESGRETFRMLARTADAVLESFPPGYLATLGLTYEDLARDNPGLVMTSITPFGQTGPYRDYQGTDIVITSLGGLVHAEGEAGETPVTMPLYQAYHMGSIHGAFGTLMALWHRDQTGQGQHVDVSLQSVAAHMHLNVVRYAATQEIAARRGSKGATGPSQYYQTKDGWAMLALTSPRQWKEFAEWVGDPRLLDPKLEVLANRDESYDLINAIAADFVAQFTTEEFLREGERHKVTVAPANSPGQFVRHPHAVTRGSFVEVTHPIVGRYETIGGPAVYSQTPWAINRPAPTLGQHNAEVLEELDGDQLASNPQTRRGRTTKVAPSGALGGATAATPSAHDWLAPAVDSGPSSNPLLPLAGIRVLAFSRAWAAPFGTRFLADYGAEVIKVESSAFPEGRVFDRERNPAGWWQSNAMYAEIHRNKLSVTLDLHTPGGQELFKRLAAASDVVVENNHPDAMKRFGLDYEALRAVKPDIIMVSCPGYGSWGPMRDFVSVGQCLTAFTGLGYLWGHPGSPWTARGKNAYPDFVTSANLNVAVMAALHHRRLTGEGQQIELPQFQATATMIGLAFLEHSINGVDPQPWGNRDPNFAPQGIFPCRGEDRWVAISCPTDASWQALAGVLGRTELADDPRYAMREGRLENQDALDEIIGRWTRTLTPHQAMYRCQRAGVPAGVVATGEDLVVDPHLRGYFVEIDHPIPGRLQHPGMTVRFTATPGRVRRPAPMLGQHTNEVLAGVLGLSPGEIETFLAEGALR